MSDTLLYYCPNCEGLNLSTVHRLDGMGLGRSGYMVECLDCGVCGPRGNDRGEAHSKWNELPRVPIWQTTPPQVPGAYLKRMWLDKTEPPQWWPTEFMWIEPEWVGTFIEREDVEWCGPLRLLEQ